MVSPVLAMACSSSARDSLLLLAMRPMAKSKLGSAIYTPFFVANCNCRFSIMSWSNTWRVRATSSGALVLLLESCCCTSTTRFVKSLCNTMSSLTIAAILSSCFAAKTQEDDAKPKAKPRLTPHLLSVFIVARNSFHKICHAHFVAAGQLFITLA